MNKWTGGQAPADGRHTGGDVETAYAVQWKTTKAPGRWAYYSRYWPNYKDALSSMEAARKCPVTLDVRIIERRQTYRVLEGEAIAEHEQELKGATHEQTENPDL